MTKPAAETTPLAIPCPYCGGGQRLRDARGEYICWHCSGDGTVLAAGPAAAGTRQSLPDPLASVADLTRMVAERDVEIVRLRREVEDLKEQVREAWDQHWKAVEASGGTL